MINIKYLASNILIYVHHILGIVHERKLSRYVDYYCLRENVHESSDSV